MTLTKHSIEYRSHVTHLHSMLLHKDVNHDRASDQVQSGDVVTLHSWLQRLSLSFRGSPAARLYVMYACNCTGANRPTISPVR